MRRRSLVLLVALGLGAGVPATAVAGSYCPPKPPPVKKKCNSGRGNGSEGNSTNLIIPGIGTGPGVVGTLDCDPGNSGAVNRGGD
jgi:hypothetical protein